MTFSGRTDCVLIIFACEIVRISKPPLPELKPVLYESDKLRCAAVGTTAERMVRATKEHLHPCGASSVKERFIDLSQGVKIIFSLF